MKIVIIGGVAAGTKAAAKSRRLLPDAQVDLYTDDNYVSYSSCGLPYFIEGNFNDYKMLIARTPEEFEQSNIHIHLRHRVTKILPEVKQILVQSENESFLVEYDKLLIATGARPFVPTNITNTNLENVFTLRNIEDGLKIKEAVLSNKKAVIVGGGYIGIELLEAFVKQGLNVTLIENSPHIMSIFDDDIAEKIETHIKNRNTDMVEILTSDSVIEMIGDTKVNAVKTKNGAIVKADFVVIAAGVRPNVSIAEDAGIILGQTGAIKTNHKMVTNFPDIYAAGDCAEKTNLVSNSPMWIPLGSTANKEGRCAALNMCGIEDRFEGILGSAVTRYFGFTMSLTGLSAKQASHLGFEPESVIVTKFDKVGYMPEAKNITLKLIADKNSRKLLGAQAIGCGDADKRVNTLTTALMSSLTVDEFFGNDITYSPPYSPSIDPLLTAADNLIKKLDS